MKTDARIVTALAALLLVLASWEAAANTTPIRPARGTWPLVLVTIDKEGPFTFLLDTGSTRTVIDESLARSLGKKPLGETTVRTPAGVIRAKLVRVDRLRVAEREQRVIALVTDIRAVRTLPKGTIGILGLNFLSRYNFFIDYGNRRLVLYERDGDRPVEGGSFVCARIDRRRLLVRAEPEAYPEPLWLALDTGAHRLVSTRTSRARWRSSSVTPTARERSTRRAARGS